MRYSISSTTNRDLQLLHHYRILRQPTDLLKAVYRGGTPIALNFSEAVDSDTGYAFTSKATIIDGKIPLLEFQCSEADYMYLAGLTELEVEPGFLTIYSEMNSLGDIEVTLYWVDSLETITSVLTAYKEELELLRQKLADLDKQVSALSSSSKPLTFKGVDNNLVKFKTQDDVTELIDAGYMIAEPVTSQTFTNPTDEFLATMVKDITDDICIHMTTDKTHTLEGFYGGGRILLQGTGTWYVINCTAQVLTYHFKGNVIFSNCNTPIVSYKSEIKSLIAINTFVVFGGKFTRVDELQLERNAVLHHCAGGKINKLLYVGPGSVYHCRIAVKDARDQPTFSWNKIVGAAYMLDGTIIMNGREVSFVTGHHDDPLPPSQLKIIPVAGNEDAPGPAPEPTPTPSGHTPFDEFFEGIVGSYIDWDGQYGVQCFDLACYYAVNLLDASPFTGAYAKQIYTDFYTQPDHDLYTRIPYTAGFAPIMGDIIVWDGTPTNVAGHVAICTGECTASSVQFYDENGGGNHEPVTLRTRDNYSNVLGVLRFNDQTKILG